MSSFRKRNVQKPIQGTRTSPHTGQVITSSGNPSLDLILGSGLPVGSICLIEEDKYVTHSKVLAKYFLAEGILSDQSVFLASLDDDPVQFFRKLPMPLNEEDVAKEKAKEQNEPSKNGLRIAWRYNDLPIVNSEQTTVKIGHYFNLSEQILPELLHYADTTVWNDTKQNILEESVEDLTEDAYRFSIDDNDDEMKSYKELKNADLTNDAPTPDESEASTGPAANEEHNDTDVQNAIAQTEKIPSIPTNGIFENQKYLRLLNELQPLLREDKFRIHATGYKGLCRVCITSLGSPLWYDEQFPKDILKFLTILRAAIRNVVAVCFITMPMHLVAKLDESLVARIRNLVDYSIELESFAGSEHETNPAYKEYSGLLHLRKITAINTLSAYMPETTDLAFKLRRKNFVIEKLHLPPELQENENASHHQPDIVPILGCGGNIGGSPTKASLTF